MTASRRALSYGSVAVALGALTLVAASRLAIARQRPYDLDFVPRAAALRWASLGHPTLVANLWWLRAVQYIGERRADERGWDKLHPAVDLVTDLDPRHGYAYQVAGNVLGSVGRVAESNALLEKGHRNVPDRYILPFHRAVNAFLYEGDYALAGRWFETAGRVPGAPARMREYAVAMYVKGNAAQTAVAFLSELYAQAEDDESRRAIRRQLDQALVEREAARIEAAAAVYVARHGFPPIALAQLELERLVPSIRDPHGAEFYVDPDGRVVSPARPHRFARPPSGEERQRQLRYVERRLEQAAQDQEQRGP